MTIAQDIENAVRVLRTGGIIVYPTDTVWGIGCDASNPQAVRKVYALKRREDSKALITLVSDAEMLSSYVDGSLLLQSEEERHSDRPTTVIYPSASGLAGNLLADDGSVGIRVTSEEISRELCKRFGGAIVSTSANISGSPTPVNFSDISSDILSGADYVMMSRRDDFTESVPSRIVKFDQEGRRVVIRP